MKAGRILLFACLFLWTGTSAWAIANPENHCSRVAAGAISNARYYDPELGRFIQADDRIPDFGNPQSYNCYSYVLNNPLRYTDPSGHEEIATGSSGRELIQEEEGASGGVVLRAKQSAGTMATAMKVGVAITPAGTGMGLLEFGTGKEAYSGEKLSWGQRGKSLGIAALPAMLKVGGKVLKAGEEVAKVEGALKEGWFAKVGKEAIQLGENRAVSGIIKDGKVIGIGDATLGHGELAKKLGIELVNGKLPQGMEGFLAQKTAGKVGIVGAGINGTGEKLVISEAGKKAAESFFK